MALTYVYNKLASINYNPRHLSTYLAVLTPGLSMLVQKIQYNRLATRAPANNVLLVGRILQIKQIRQICAWHYGGALVQVVAGIALATLASSYFAWIGTAVVIIAGCQGIENQSTLSLLGGVG